MDSESRRGGDLFIVDNSDADWKVLQYLREWCEIARAFDIATGYFEIGSLLALDGQWQHGQRVKSRHSSFARGRRLAGESWAEGQVSPFFICAGRRLAGE